MKSWAIRAGAPDGYSDLDSAPFVPRGIVLGDAFDWGDDRPPEIPYSDTIVYEIHVKGFTQRHPDVPVELRGTYAGLASPAAIDHLRTLASRPWNCCRFTTTSTTPCFELRGSTTTGATTLSAASPRTPDTRPRLEPGEPVARWPSSSRWSRRFTRPGFEVILDVVFNHTAEGSHLGPTLSFRGFDNPGYYRLVADDPRYYFDTTGTGNTLNADSPVCLRLVMDSLRYWVTEMHVDGFRFDLAVALARGAWRVRQRLDLLRSRFAGPVISQVKLIAEPWDVGQPDSDDLGRFPDMWSEWNGKYRDTVRTSGAVWRVRCRNWRRA